MYRWIFSAKYFGVRNMPASPYQLGRLYSVGSALNAPGTCLSIPIAMPISYSPRRIVFDAWVSTLAAVAHPLYMLKNGIPVIPNWLTTESGLSTS